MAESNFERQLSRMFAEPTAFADASAFADRVRRRLDRSWALRRLFISLAGAAGGGVAAAQLMGSNLLRHAVVASRALMHELHRVSGWLPSVGSGSHLGLQGAPLGGEAMWLIAAMVVVAVALLATRLVEEF